MLDVTLSYACNLCNWNGPAFLKRDDSLVCPRCFSRQRHRSIYQYLSEKNLLKGKYCLDVATKRIFQRRLSYLEYVTIDKISGWADYEMDICDLKFDDDRFDLIICCSVLQFVADYQSALKEMYRVLKPGGTCIIQIPYDMAIEKTIIIDSENSSAMRNFQSNNHQVCFSYKNMIQQLEQYFEVETYLYSEPVFAFSEREFFVCKKMK